MHYNLAEEDTLALDPVLQELVDKAAIRDQMARYSRGADGRDPDLIASTFASDAYTVR